MNVLFSNDVLRMPCGRVAERDVRLDELVAKLEATLASTADGLALSAPQIGVSLRVFVVHDALSAFEKTSRVFVNPIIERRSRKTETDREACLSLPGQVWLVSRAKTVEVSYELPTSVGLRHVAQFDGLAARIFQHEMDHLDGVLIDQRGFARVE